MGLNVGTEDKLDVLHDQQSEARPHDGVSVTGWLGWLRQDGGGRYQDQATSKDTGELQRSHSTVLDT